MKSKSNVIDRRIWKRLPEARRMDLVSAISDLSLTGARKSKGNSALVQRGLAKRMLSAFDRAERIYIRMRDDKVEGVVYQYWDNDIFPGLRVRNVEFAVADTQSSSITSWVMDRLASMSSSWCTKTIATLPVGARCWTNRLRRLGMGVEFVVLQGETSRSRRLIKQHYGARDLKCPDGVWLRPMLRSDLDSVMSIKRREFRRNPQYGWMCATPSYLRIEEQRIASELRRKLP